MTVVFYFFALFVAAVTVAFAAQKECTPVNICYVIDESGSIDGNEFAVEETAAMSMTNELHKLSSKSLYSVVAFNTNARTIADPVMDIHALRTVFRNAKRRGGGTSIAAGLKRCQQMLDGFGDTRMVMLFSDGRDSTQSDSFAVAEELEKSGIMISAVGISSSLNEHVLKTIASDPDLYSHVNQFSSLRLEIFGRLSKFCELKPDQPKWNMCGRNLRDAQKCKTQCGSDLRCPSGLQCYSVSTCAAQTPAPEVKQSCGRNGYDVEKCLTSCSQNSDCPPGETCWFVRRGCPPLGPTPQPGQNSCGRSFEEASKCETECEYHWDCPGDELCWSNQPCGTDPAPTPIQLLKACGAGGWEDAMKCEVECFDDTQCDKGESCYALTHCDDGSTNIALSMVCVVDGHPICNAHCSDDLNCPVGNCRDHVDCQSRDEFNRPYPHIYIDNKTAEEGEGELSKSVDEMKEDL